MTDYYYVEPEVTGSATVRTDEPDDEETLVYEFEGWLGDELVESVSKYVVTDALLERIEAAELTGYRRGQVEVSKSPKFTDRYPDRTLPEFHWLVVDGAAGDDDFGMGEQYDEEYDTEIDVLVVSDRALAVLEDGQFDHADVEPYEK